MWEQSAFWYQYQLARLKQECLPSSYQYVLAQFKLSRLQKFIKSQLPFYHDLQTLRFNQLPIIDKGVMQENFEQLNTLSMSYITAKELLMNHRAWHANQSVGTAGKSGIYLFSAMEKRNELASILSRLLPSNGIVPKKVAIFYLTPTPYFSDIKTRCFQWQFLDLKVDPQTLVQRLESFSPDAIVAPVQMLCKLAHLQLENKISLNPKKLISVHEVLTPIEEKLISTTFKQNVHQIYQCAEGFLGTTCEMGTLHLNEEQYFIEPEWIDEKKQKFIPVITSLNRFVQPLVRYRLHDILSQRTTPCPCGSTHMAIESIIGRCEDMLYFQKIGNSGALKLIYSDEIHQVIGRASGGIEKYQFIQHSPLQLEIRIQAKNTQLAKNCISQQLEKLTQLFGVRCPYIEFVSLDFPPICDLFRQTMRLVKHPIL